MLSAVTDRVEYLTVAAVPVRRAMPADGDGWLECSDLAGGGHVLAAALAASQFGTHDPAVRASLFFQGYAFRIASVVLGPYALGLPAPTVAPANVVVRSAGFGIGAVGVHSTAVDAHDVAGLSADLLDGHLALVIAALRRDVVVGDRLLRANAASACARVLRAVEGACEADRDDVRARGAAFMTATRLGELGGFVTVAPAADAGSPGDVDGAWEWRRKSCCLWFRCDGGGYCDDCNMDAATRPSP